MTGVGFTPGNSGITTCTKVGFLRGNSVINTEVEFVSGNYAWSGVSTL